MINKRGDEGNLLKETLEIILFVVGTAILIFAIWKVWDLVANQERVNADKLVDDIVRRANDAKEGEIEGFTIKGLKDWYLVGWSKNEIGRLDKCFFKSCICICPFGKKTIKETCQDEGICKELNFDSSGVFTLSKIKEKENLINDEEIIKQTTDPKYFRGGEFKVDGVNVAALIPCLGLYENNLFKLSIYKDKTNLAVINVETNDPAVFKFQQSCAK